MTKVIKSDSTNGAEQFINSIKNKELLIYEDIQGSKIFVKYTGNGFVIKTKSIDNEPLSFLDLTIQKYYNKAFLFFNSLPDSITNLLNKNWWFCFEYFPSDDRVAHIEYEKLPKNNLVLTCIVKGNKYTYNYEEVLEYSRLFDVDPLPVIFKGVLNDKQLEVINLFLNTSDEDLSFVFEENNFAYLFYKTLNPYLENSFLMKSDNFNENLEKIIIKVDGDDKYSFELLNPLHKRMIEVNNTEYSQTYSLILISFVEFLQLIELKNTKIESFRSDEVYVELICKLFNNYINDVKLDIDKWNFKIPKFFTEDKFKVNLELLKNKKTVDLIKDYPKIEYVFKVILSSFNKKRKKPIGVFTEQTLLLFNDTVDKINQYIEKVLKINREILLQKNDLLNFKDYFGIEYNTDSTGNVYPNTNKTIDDISSGDKKKKKKI